MLKLVVIRYFKIVVASFGPKHFIMCIIITYNNIIKIYKVKYTKCCHSILTRRS